MGLLGKTLGFANKFKNNLAQGILKAKDFVYNNRENIGGALKAMSPYISAINPALGSAASMGASFLQNLKPGPVKDKLKKLTHDSYDDTSPKSTTVDSGAQQAVERRRRALGQSGGRSRKKARLTVQE